MSCWNRWYLPPKLCTFLPPSPTCTAAAWCSGLSNKRKSTAWPTEASVTPRWLNTNSRGGVKCGQENHSSPSLSTIVWINHQQQRAQTSWSMMYHELLPKFSTKTRVLQISWMNIQIFDGLDDILRWFYCNQLDDLILLNYWQAIPKTTSHGNPWLFKYTRLRLERRITSPTNSPGWNRSDSTWI